MTTFQKLIIGILGLTAVWVMVSLTVFVGWYVTTKPASEQTIIIEATPTSKKAEVTSTPKQTEESKSPLITPEEILENDTKNANSETITKTPNPIVNAVVAGGGKYVILKMQAFPGLAVYDADEKKIVHTLRLASDNFLYTAGGQVVLVYYPENNLLQTWNLETFEKLKTKPNPNGAIITYMTMGHNNGHRALVRYAAGTEALNRVGMYLLDTTALQEIPVNDDGNRLFGHNSSYRDFIHQRTDGAMQIVSEWATSHSPSGLGIFLLSDNSWTSVYDHTSVGYIAVGDDGLIYTQTGSIYNSQLTKIGDLPGTKLIPGIGGTLFLGIADNGSMQLYASGSISPIGPVGHFPDLSKNSRAISGAWASTPYGFDRRVVFDPKHGRIILLPLENDRIIQRDFDLEQLLAASGVDYLVVTSTPNTNATSGETWRYKIETLSNAGGIKFILEFGPDGMAMSDDGTLTWNVPTNHSGPEKVVVLIENEDGEAIYQNFELQIK